MTAQLARFSYRAEAIKISESFRTELGNPSWLNLPSASSAVDVRYEGFQNAGDKLRRRLKRRDAALLPALSAIVRKRKQLAQLAEGLAFVIDSLKTPAEIALLRRIYGSRFLALSVYSPRLTRRDDVATRTAASRHEHRIEPFFESAERILNRDQRGAELNPYGQDVGNAFPLADLFLDASQTETLSRDLARFFDILFSYPYATPTLDEYGMALAHTARLRSASMTRQVGAALTDDRGRVIATGTNEVPRSGGGPYWPEDIPDHRDFTTGGDTSYRMRRDLLGDVLQKLLVAGWRPPDLLKPHLSADETLEVAQKELKSIWSTQDKERLISLRRGLLIQDTMEFFREVHAEMAAVLDAAFSGTSTKGGILFVSAFPCHECAKHIVWAGIRRVVYLEPYPKSLVAEFYGDSIAIENPDETGRVDFRPFRGIAPSRYSDFFPKLERRREDGRVIAWRERTAPPRFDVLGIPMSPARVDDAFRKTEAYSVRRREATALAELSDLYQSRRPP
jgi:deoxycytidylate deaminase